MPRRIRFAAFCCLASLLSVLGFEPSLSADDHAPPPDWIWASDTSHATTPASPAPKSCRLERRFQVDHAPRSASLRLAADFCLARVEINGQKLVSVEPYSPTVDADVSAAILRGENRIVIAAESVAGPAAVALSLSLVSPDGRRIDIVTSGHWQVVNGDGQIGPAVPLGAVDPAVWGIGRRAATIDPFENYEQWRQAIGTPAVADQAAFWTAPGFAISLIRQAQPDEGSWVSLAFDPQGRITIAREDKGLLRMTLDSVRTSIQRVETINDELQECRGLLYAYDALYANANNSKGLYRLRDTDGNDQFDEVRLLREFPGSLGHGRNDLALGPDGLIYSIHGDAVDIPKENITDHTSPFRDARRGKNTREGHLLRTDRDGQNWELLTAGLRNPFGIAFNSRGDLFTYDADAEFDMGSPWYRPTRIDQLVAGADFGWRGVTGKWPPYFPDHADNALPTLDIGRGSPTSVAFGTQTSFPAEYRRALFVLDWTYGRILAVHLAPRGAGYRSFAETFLKGRPLNVTDLAPGPNGALYLVTGGRKTQSALYRVAFTGKETGDAPPSSHEAACQKHSAVMRQLRLQLESLHRLVGEKAVELAWPHLDSPDPTIRHAARTAIEHQPLELWRERALAADRSAAFAAFTALARSGEKDTVPQIIDRLVGFDADELTVGQALELLQIYFLCLEQAPDSIAERRRAILSQLEPFFPHPAAEGLSVSAAGTGAKLNRDLARWLAQLESPSLVEKVSRSLLASSVQEDRLLGLFALRSSRSGWSNETRRTYFTALNQAESFVAGEGMPKFLSQIREQAMSTLSAGESDALADLLAPRTETNAEPLPLARPLVKQWTLDDFDSLLGDSVSLGDPARGEAVFRDALCVRCHRAGARGPAVGPDLSHVAGRFSRRDMLESIVSPNKVVAENYRNVQIATTDGRQIVGRVLLEGDFRSEKLRIATEPLRASTVVEISKREIDQIRESETSPMPQSLLDSFTKQDVFDLLSFLARGN